ncbi:hypothetical protein TRVL_08393 [Trypanosoma vivax]|nr:hypothetical protein TRVL_08393 [Trypanosoma vivax]
MLTSPPSARRFPVSPLLRCLRFHAFLSRTLSYPLLSSCPRRRQRTLSILPVPFPVCVRSRFLYMTLLPVCLCLAIGVCPVRGVCLRPLPPFAVPGVKSSFCASLSSSSSCLRQRRVVHSIPHGPPSPPLPPFYFPPRPLHSSPTVPLCSSTSFGPRARSRLARLLFALVAFLCTHLAQATVPSAPTVFPFLAAPGRKRFPHSTVIVLLCVHLRFRIPQLSRLYHAPK